MESKKFNNLLKVLFNLIVFVKLTNGLYEDQIKKFDWLQLNLGKLVSSNIDPIPSNHRILVTTEENVLAAISTINGEVQWRQLFEKPPRGDIKLFQFVSEDTAAAVQTNRQNSNLVHDIITVSGSSPAIIRGWSAGSGNLEWEWSILPLCQSDKAESAVWFYDNNFLYHVIPFWGSHLEITKYHAANGQTNGQSSKITAPWIQNSDKCLLVHPYYLCIERNQLIYLDLSSNQPLVQRKQLQEEIKELPKVVKGRPGTMLFNGKVITLINGQTKCEHISMDSVIHSEIDGNKVFVYSKHSKKTLDIEIVSAESCENLGINLSIDLPEYYGKPEVFDFNCRIKRNGEKDCNTLISTEDGAIIYMQQDKIKWSREESLTKIIATELIDLPLADSEGAIKNELNSKTVEDLDADWDVGSAFFRRLASQMTLIKNIFFHVIGLGPPPSATQKAGLIRDSFGLHKILIILTESGKLYGMDNLNANKIYWQRYLPHLRNFNRNAKMKLLIQRTSKHFPHEPLCIIVGKNFKNDNGVIYNFNPITGNNVVFDELNYKIKQLSLLKENEFDFIKGLLLLDENNQAHVIPDTLKDLANGMYLYTADEKTSTLTGYNVQLEKGALKTIKIWNVNLGGHGNSQKILKIKGKNPIENVHSQGRVLADRSVLYKYINPNLIAVLTQGFDSIHKYVMNIYLIDAVSGSVVFSMNHKKIREPVNIVHSENWLVYSYYNDKVRRTEITTIELYEGKVQANGSIWSSLDAPPLPLIERQSYIIPTTVETMKETITERGITSKHVLIGTSNGGVIEMPWSYLDPRRPIAANQMREEGLSPYIPELILPAENFINYNQTIGRIREIYTAPSGLESTCLVVAYGLDLYLTRVSPSKTFDLLKEDFDYFLISVVLVVLTSSSFLVKYLSARKALKQAWK